MITKQIMRDITFHRSEKMPVTERTKSRDRDLKKACKELESIFTYQLLKSMRRTIEKTDLFHGGQGEEIYESLLDQELSKSLAGSGQHSLASLLYEQLKSRDSSNLEQAEGVEGKERPDEQMPAWPVKNPVSLGFGRRKYPIDGQNRFRF